MNADELQAMQALNLAVDGYRERAEAAEARVRELEQTLVCLHGRCDCFKNRETHPQCPRWTLRVVHQYNELHLERCRLSEQLAAANALLRTAHDKGVKPVLRKAIRVHLTAQPAAPHGTCAQCGSWLSEDCADCSVCAAELPASATRHADGCAWYVGGLCTRGCDKSAAPTATPEEEETAVAILVDSGFGSAAPTDHERAVLEAAAKLSTESLEAFGRPASTPWVVFAHAELARREAKR